MSIITNELNSVCRENADKTAFIYPLGDTFVKKSFLELLEDIEGKIAYLLHSGVKSGERILAFAKESYDLCVFMAAAMSIGASIMYIDIWAKEERLKLGYDKYRPEYAVVSRKTARFKSFFSGINKISKTLFVEESLPKRCKITDRPDESTTALITMTTGSTGEPKAAIRTHRHLFEQLKLVKNNMNSEKHETVLTTSFMYAFANILNGFTTVLAELDLSKDTPQRLQHKLDSLASLPISMMFTTPDLCLKTHNSFPTLGEVFIGGAILNLREAELIKSNYDNIKITYVYGATECNLISRTTLDEYITTLRKACRSCLGCAVDGVEIKTDADNRIFVTSAALLKSYLGRDEMTNKLCDSEGKLWHMTGDAGVISDGKLYYLGRNDMRISGKNTVYSNEIEQALAVHFDFIEKCAAVPTDGRLHIFLQLKNGACFERDTILSFIQNELSLSGTVLHRIRKIPCDVKHHTKIDYKKLIAQLK